MEEKDTDEYADNVGYIEDTEEIGEPTREEYERLIETVYKEYYDSDIKAAIESKEANNAVGLSDEDWLKITEKYPECIRENELKDPLFVALLKLSDRETAADPVRIYELAHFDEMIAAAERLGAEAAERRVLDRVRAKRSRPGENGIQRVSGQIRKNVSEMTRNERAALAARAANGEHIKL